MKNILYFTLALSYCIEISAQEPKDFGFRHFQYEIGGDTVDVLIKSKKGEEKVKKPLYFSIQGSLGVPLIVHDGTNRVMYSTLEEGFVEEDYHLVVVNKPGIPLLAHKDSLVDGREYFVDKNQYIYPEKYLRNNHLDFYVNRNLQVLDSLFKEDWVDTSKLVLSGHSQGSGICLSMSTKTTKATHLIYSSGLPYYSTILAMLSKERMREGNEPSERVGRVFRFWKEVLDDPSNFSNPNRDSNLTLHSFSQNENEALKQLKIPVLISFGTLDESSPYQDMFRLETIKEQISHITFNDYVGLGHNYQLVNPGSENEKTDFLADVVEDWLEWIEDN